MVVSPLNKILYADDDLLIRKIAQIALEVVGGFELKLCDSGENAIEIAVEFLPDLFLLDVMMPVLDGPATFQELKKLPALNRIPVIFMTANTLPDDIEMLIRLGALAVIPKPFDPLRLAEQLLSVWNSQN